jgi:hypothetical protein
MRYPNTGSTIFAAALMLAGCATVPPVPRWESVRSSNPRVTFEIDRASVTRRGDRRTIVVRTSFYEEQSAHRAPFAAYLFFDQPYEFSCRERSYTLLPWRSYYAYENKWRDFEGTGVWRPVDWSEVRDWKPDLYATQVRAFDIACAPLPRPKARPGGNHP